MKNVLRYLVMTQKNETTTIWLVVDQVIKQFAFFNRLYFYFSFILFFVFLLHSNSADHF